MTSFQRFVTALLFGLFPCALLAQAPAGRWTPLTADKVVSITYDSTRIERAPSGEIITWLRWDYAKTKTDTNALLKVYRYDYTLDKTGFDCIAHRYRLYSVFYYLSKGELTDQFTNQQDQPRWNDPVPDSYGEGMVNAACGATKKP